jgi:hypothetical protein
MACSEGRHRTALLDSVSDTHERCSTAPREVVTYGEIYVIQMASDDRVLAIARCG